MDLSGWGPGGPLLRPRIAAGHDGRNRGGAALDTLVRKAVERTNERRLPSPRAAALLADALACAMSGAPVADRLVSTVIPAVCETDLPSCADTAAWWAVAIGATDRDDVHWPSGTHPGGVVWPVVLASLEARPPRMWRAASLGYELVVAVAFTLGAAHRYTWHATSTAGSVGAAAAAAFARGGSVDTCIHAAGHALSVAGGSAQAFAEMSGTRLFHRAHAARVASAAADAALAGLPATRYGLEGICGLRLMDAEGDATPEDPFSPEPAMDATALRLLPGTGYGHCATEAALTLAPDLPGAIAEVEVELQPGHAVAGSADPDGIAGRWWSVAYGVAAALTGGSIEAVERAMLEPDSRAIALYRRVRMTGSSDRSGALVRLRGGRGEHEVVREASCSLPAGHPARPLEISDLAAKWKALHPSLADEVPAELLTVIEHVVEPTCAAMVRRAEQLLTAV